MHGALHGDNQPRGVLGRGVGKAKGSDMCADLPGKVGAGQPKTKRIRLSWPAASKSDLFEIKVFVLLYSLPLSSFLLCLLIHHVVQESFRSIDHSAPGVPQCRSHAGQVW